MGVDDSLVEPAALAPEQQKRVRSVDGIAIAARRLSREKVQLIIAVSREERLDARPPHNLDIIPIVASGPLQVLLRQPKPHRLHQMQPRPHARARASDVPRILRNLRFHKNDVQHYACSC